VNSVREVLEKKVSAGTLTDKEIAAFQEVEKEKRRERAADQAVKDERAGREEGDCFLAGRAFPGKSASPEDILLPFGYCIAKDGVYQANKEESEPDQDPVYTTALLTKTPFFIAGRDVTLGKVLLLRRIGGTWYQDWVRAGQIKPSLLADLFIFPAPSTKVKTLIQYAHACCADAPLLQAPDDAEGAAKAIYDELFPKNENVELPFLVAVPRIRKMCKDLEVSYNEIRKIWQRWGIIDSGEGRVKRVKADEADQMGVDPGPQRFLEIIKIYKPAA
jgi:hypothetical protein